MVSKKTHFFTASGKNFFKARRNTWQLYILLLPALLYIILFHYKPMYGVLIAFKNFSLKKGILQSPWCGLENFRQLFSSFWFPIILKNTIGISLLSLLICFPMPIIVALMLNELKNGKSKKIIQTVSYAPHFISTVVICGMLILFLSPSSGIINKLIEPFCKEPVYFLRDAQYFKGVFVLSDLWQGLGWGTIIYTAALAGVDKSLLEAAEMDGASRFQKILYINLPVLIPTILVLFILQCGSILSVGYEKVFLLQTDTNLRASEVISTYVYKVGLQDNNFSFSTAADLFNSVVNASILIIVNTITNRINKNGLW